ncbi:Nuclear pore complex protein NUP54 [Camellia lanceoleosa]|uniref:Nuclear pore complex protein NUP54 n=1 Tax=Camellia lanceoleosa TaxID=1840588 RepID=A0ACC0GSC3_9ERIC|nr:Nuclear pore complex protein NUP54 [Camellia lanceoleosa]
MRLWSLLLCFRNLGLRRGVRSSSASVFDSASRTSSPTSSHFQIMFWLIQLQDEVIFSDVERLRMTQSNVKLLQRYFQAYTLPWIERMRQKEQGLQRRLLRVLQQQTEAIARLGNVLKRDIRDMEIIMAEDKEMTENGS